MAQTVADIKKRTQPFGAGAVALAKKTVVEMFAICAQAMLVHKLGV
ncbi:hypothetical protein SDC9_134517 [bioreactor metagenome]|uniref:Uncharacterized protein n=1 Tax=bioreactor metagenome TaxID=1076179 RepID=A0A645DDJ7_9ZZZZ